MADINYNDYGVAAALGQLAQAQEAMALRPQKTSTYTTTTTTSTPRALEDMVARRNMIGANNQNLIDALKPREGFLYRFGQGLANVTPQNESGAGWLSGFLRGVGSGLTSGTDARIAREQAAQELAQKDLETALAYDKAMGETQKQIQNQTVGYTEMPYAGGKTQQGGTGRNGEWKDFDWTGLGPQFNLIDFVKDHPELYNSIAQLATETDENDRLTGRGLLARQMMSNEQLGLRSSTLDEVRKIASGRLTKAVKELGGARGIDTMREAIVRAGNILSAPVQTSQEYAGNLENARQEMLKGINNSRALEGLAPISDEQFSRYWNSMWNVPLNLSEADKEKYVTYPSSSTQPTAQTNTQSQQNDYSKYGF